MKIQFPQILKLIILAALASAVPAEAVKSVTLLTDALSVKFDTQPNAFSILDKRTGRQWQTPDMAGRFPVRQITNFNESGFSMIINDRMTGEDFEIVVFIDEDRLDFTTSAIDPEAPFANLPYPALPESDLESGQLLFCNRGSGIVLPVTTTDYPEKTLVAYANTGALDLPLFGILDGQNEDGLLLTFETPTEVSVDITPDDDGIIRPSMSWFHSFDKFRYSRKHSFHFIDKGGYVAMADRFDNWKDRIQPYITLEEKAEERPVVEWLKGAVVVWGGIGERIVYEGPVHGIHRMMLNGRFSNAAMQKAKDLGYLLGEYDNYSDVTPMTLSKSEKSIEDIALRDKNGDIVLGWRTLDGKQYYNRSSRFAVQAAKDLLPDLIEKYPYTARFLDVHSTLQFFESYHPGNPMDRREDMKNRQDLYGYVSSLGLVSGGEAAKAWAVPYVDYTEGNMSGSYYWFSDVGHLVPLESRDEIPPEFLKFGMDQSIRVPLWELVYHDEVASTWYWGDSNGYLYNIAPEMSDVKDAMNVLYGTMSLVWLDHLGYGWDRHRDRLLRTVYTTTRLHERIGFDEMLDHKFLSDDGLVQETRFSSGAIVVANLSKTPRKISLPDGESVTLAPNGYHVTSDDIQQSRLWIDGAAETHVQADDFLYVRSEAAEPRKMGPAVLSGELAAFSVNGKQWNIRYKSGNPVSLDLVDLGILEEGDSFRAAWINARGQFTAPFTSTADGTLTLPPTEESQLLAILPGMQATAAIIMPQLGRVTTETEISIVTEEPDATIRYTLNGKNPNWLSPKYTGPFTLEKGASIRAAAFKWLGRTGKLSKADLSVEVPLFTSPVVKGTDPAVEVKLPVDGLTELHIQITDARDGPNYDQAVLGDAFFIKKDGSRVSLAEYPPLSSVKFDFARNRNNYEGDPIVIDGKTYETGISSHSIDKIVYRIEDDFVAFEAFGGIHDRTSEKGPKGQKNGSVQFIFTGISNP